eukprot:SAG11_NODE_1167_length_5620_cov_7.048723_4_plen_564_part_00
MHTVSLPLSLLQVLLAAALMTAVLTDATARAALQLVAGDENSEVGQYASPLAGLPALPKTHLSYGNCQVSEVPAPNVPCPFPVDSNNALQLDFARITHAWPVEIALGGGCCPGGMRRDAAGNHIWDPVVLEKSLNKTEVVEATKLCAKANASITVNWSPWAYFWGGQLGVNWNRTGPANPAVWKRECPTGPGYCGEATALSFHCLSLCFSAFSCCSTALTGPLQSDPSVEGSDEEMELRFFSTQLRQISEWINETNAAIASNVQIGGILLDSEQFLINFGNATQVNGLKRKDDLVYNVCAQFCFPPLCTIEQYNRGTIAREATLAKPDEGIPPDDAWTEWPGTTCGSLAYPLGKAACAATTTYDTFGTSLYCIPEIGYTREAYSLTVKNAASVGASTKLWVTPWLWLGGGCRRRVNAHSPGTSGCDPKWDCAFGKTNHRIAPRIQVLIILSALEQPLSFFSITSRSLCYQDDPLYWCCRRHGLQLDDGPRAQRSLLRAAPGTLRAMEPSAACGPLPPPVLFDGVVRSRGHQPDGRRHHQQQRELCLVKHRLAPFCCLRTRCRR